MKTLNRILVVSAIAASFTLASQAKADDKTVLSPRARQMQNSLLRSGRESNDMLDRSVKSVSPRALAAQESLHRNPNHENDVLVRNAIPGNARLWANNPAGASTWGQPVHIASNK